MSGWALLLAAALFAIEALAARAREPRPERRSDGPPTPVRLARLGRPLATLTPPWLRPAPDARVLRRTALPIAGEDVAAARLASAVLFGGLGVAAAVAVRGAFGVTIAMVLLAFGCAYPDLWLRSAAKRRSARIERSAPALLELVAAGVAAGVALDAALIAAGRAVGHELEEELERSRAAIALGRPRGEEFRDLSERTGAPTLAALGLALRLSDRLGVPLADSLRDQATRSRAEAARAVLERAARAGPRVLVVVVFVLVPAALLPIAAAVALTLAGALGGA